MIKSILGGKSKNLFDISKADVVIHSDMSFSSNVSYNSHFYSIPVEAGQTYTVSYDIYAIDGGGSQIALSCQTGDFYQDGVSLVVQLTPDHSINNWNHITNTFTIPSGATKITFSSLKYPDYPKYFRNFQIEKGSTATEYVPHELTSYKSIMKVSDVCQLLDKSKYPATRTNNGITFTNNGDGSFTIDGTISRGISVLIVAQISNLIVGHKYYSPTSQHINGIYVETKIDRNNAATIWQSGKIHKWAENETTMYISLLVDSSRINTVENAILIPQLFDLTEIFGAGNEPKTVAEFKAKFPNDYYPYSPSCFVTSFDERMPCKTKNLFDKSNVQIINGYISGSNVFSESSLDKTIIIPCLPNTTYTFSKISVYPFVCDRLRIGDYTAIPTIGDTINNVVNIGEPPTQNYITITTSDTAKYIVVTIGLFKPTVITSLDYILSTCQLELGTTATDYVPYGYV